MAVHRPRFNLMEQEIYRDVFKPEVMHDRIPRMDEVLEGAAMLRDLHEEIGTLGRFQKAAGFTNDRSMQRVAKIDTNMQLMLEDMHRQQCTCGNDLWGAGGHKEWFYAWLKDYGQAHDVRGKIIV